MQIQDLFVSGQEDYHTYRIPALAVAPDGAVLAFCEARRHSWPTARVLEPGAAAYSDLAVAPDGQVLCLYEAERSGCLRLARFAPTWIEGGT